MSGSNRTLAQLKAQVDIRPLQECAALWIAVCVSRDFLTLPELDLNMTELMASDEDLSENGKQACVSMGRAPWPDRILGIRLWRSQGGSDGRAGENSSIARRMAMLRDMPELRDFKTWKNGEKTSTAGQDLVARSGFLLSPWGKKPTSSCHGSGQSRRPGGMVSQLGAPRLFFKQVGRLLISLNTSVVYGTSNAVYLKWAYRWGYQGAPANCSCDGSINHLDVSGVWGHSWGPSTIISTLKHCDGSLA